MSTSHLDGRFVGLRSTVAEKDFIRSRVFAKPVCQSRLGWNKIQIGNVVHGLHLLGDRRIQLCVGMS